VRVAIIYRPKTPVPPEMLPVMMGALGEWVEANAQRFSTFEFFAAGGGLVVADLADSAVLHRVVAENPFTPYMEVEILPVIEPGVAMQTWADVAAALARSAG
jgi:hypothetical protein